VNNHSQTVAPMVLARFNFNLCSESFMTGKPERSPPNQTQPEHMVSLAGGALVSHIYIASSFQVFQNSDQHQS
jgi:hypothetical protein